MGFIDSVIGVLSPRTACEREAWRQQLEEMKRSGYDAGSYSRLNANWRVFNDSAETTDRHSRNVIRARMRDLERNSDIAQSVIRAYRRNVVGKGYALQARSTDEEINNQLEELWKQWCKKSNCDVTGTQSFNQMLRMAVNRKKVDGGILFLKRYTPGGIVPFKLQALEVDELDESQTIPKTKGNKVVGGIEYTPYNKPVGYFICQYDVEGFKANQAQYVKAADVIFLYTKNRPSQIREISDMTAAVTRIRDTNEFITAVSVKERIAACLAVFIKKTIPSNLNVGRNSIPTGEGRIDYAGKTLTPGMIREMNAGDEVQVVDPKNAGSDATNFLKMQQGLISSGQGLSYETTTRDMSRTNYSSARQSIIEDDTTYAEEIEMLQDDFMTEVYETFVISCYLAGILNIPGFWDKKTDYLKHEWVASPKKWIDPKKESDANRIALQTGQKTFKQMAAENGKDWKAQIDDMAEVMEYGREVGIEMGGVIFGQQQIEQTPDDEDDEGGKGAEE